MDKSEKISTKYVETLKKFEINSTKFFNHSEDLNRTLNALTSGLEVYKEKTDGNINIFFEFEERKNIFSVILFIFYVLMIFIVILLFIKKFKHPINFISNAVTFTIPLLIVLAGVIAIYFFIYSDFCSSIHDSIYEDYFPIYDKGIGKIVSCFSSVFFYNIFKINFNYIF